MTKLGFRVYVFDNSPFGGAGDYSIQSNPNIIYLTAGKNVGIGYALATLCATAYAQGFSSLLYLDQDTSISARTLEFIQHTASTIPKSIQSEFAALVFDGQKADHGFIQQVRLAISSGSLFNLSLLREIGWHNENYFVDCVDYEFCLRARRYGFKIGRIGNTPDFDHVTEQPDRAIKIFGKKILVRRYSKQRMKGSVYAFLRLIFGGMLKNSFSDTANIIKSFLIYVAAQFISRLTK
jgi:rhamnosyltransferase